MQEFGNGAVWYGSEPNARFVASQRTRRFARLPDSSRRKKRLCRNDNQEYQKLRWFI
jgi:hypothetical protein